MSSSMPSDANQSESQNNMPIDIQPDANSSDALHPVERASDSMAQETSTFYLTGLRVDGRNDRPDLYTFLIEQGGQMLTLIHDGQVIFFTHLSLAETALKTARIAVAFKSVSQENVYLIDVSQTLFLLQSQSVDERKVIANTLDFFARILTSLGVGVPPVFADALIEFGNYVDQNTFYGDFIEKKTITRARTIDAVRWCLGTVFSLARILTPEA